jgi:hypothetical protein
LIVDKSETPGNRIYRGLGRDSTRATPKLGPIEIEVLSPSQIATLFVSEAILFLSRPRPFPASSNDIWRDTSPTLHIKDLIISRLSSRDVPTLTTILCKAEQRLFDVSAYEYRKSTDSGVNERIKAMR